MFPLDQSRKNWQNPVVRAKIIAGITRAWDDPLFYAIQTAIIRTRVQKLTDKERVTIQRRYKAHDKINGAFALAKEFKVHPNTIYRILKEEF
jgi:Helix-turn-helix domain